MSVPPVRVLEHQDLGLCVSTYVPALARMGCCCLRGFRHIDVRSLLAFSRAHISSWGLIYTSCGQV